VKGALAGRAIVVTRARDQAGELAEALESLGARVIELPVIEIAPVRDTSSIDQAIDRLETYDLVAFGSKNAAEAFLSRVRARGRKIERPLIAAVGAKTARHLSEIGLPPSIVPPTFRAEALAEAIADRFEGDLTGRRVLLPRADEGREVLIDLLTARGAIVDRVTAYELRPAPPAPEVTIGALAKADAFTFLSGKTLEFFLQVVPEAEARAFLARAMVAVIGPVAKEAADTLGVRVDVVPPAATVESLVEALALSLGPGE
jgi:uroporphyrinogen III methyltransferase / synthase